MNAEQWKKVKTIYQRAIETAPEKLSFLLDESCGGNADLRREVEEMLRFHNTDLDFIEEPIFDVATHLLVEKETLPIGIRIDNYRIVREIGRGGMGVVYEAERVDGLFEQRVAVKIIKRGMDTDAILKRFTLERQILAQLDHPNIARLLDGGTTEDSLPYFVMEYVEGLPIDKFCAEKKLNEKLELFRKVCSAVQYAHQNLVIHRDLKPSNIIISAKGEPKLLDFGIAKLFHTKPSGETELTETSNRLLTPEYASPEQTSGAKITTQSDVYSLGILLARLVSSPKSQVSSQIEESQRSNSDLEAILQTAIREESALRYPSVEAFSEDIRRFLAGLPVLARKDSFGYRAVKFVKRNSLAVGLSVLTVSALIFAAVFSSWQSYRANRAQIKAEQRFNDVRKLANSLLFEYHDKVSELQGSTELRQKMLADSLAYLDNLAQDSGDDATLLYELAIAYRKVGDVQGRPYLANVGDTKAALESYRKSEQIFLKLIEIEPNNRDFQLGVCNTYSNIADIQTRQFEHDAAIESQQKSLAILEKLIAEKPDDETTKTVLIKTLVSLGDALAGKSGLAYGKLTLEQRTNLNAEGAEPEKWLGQSLEYFQRALKFSEEIVAKNKNVGNLFKVYVALQRVAFRLEDFGFHRHEAKKADESLKFYQAALQYHEKSQQILQNALEIEPENVRIKESIVGCKMVTADVQTKLGDFKNALQNYQEAEKVYEENVKKDAPNQEAKRDLVNLYDRLGRFYVASKNADEAIKFYRKAAEIMGEVTRNDPNKSDEELLKSMRWWAANAEDYIAKQK